jgi:hypothetical protein
MLVVQIAAGVVLGVLVLAWLEKCAHGCVRTVLSALLGRREVILPFLAPLAFVVFVVLPAIVVTLWGRDT